MTPIIGDLKTRGFACFATGNSSISTIRVAQDIGDTLVADDVANMQILVPKRSEGLERSSYSGLYGMRDFPLHTDLAHWYEPPRYLLLRCIEPSQDVITHVVRSEDIFGLEREITLKRALFRPRRRLEGRLTCLRLREGECNRWDSTFISPVNALASKLQSRIEDRIKNAKVESIFLKTKGDCLLIDNWKMLHGRSLVPLESAHRRIERVYLTSIKI